MASYEFPLCSDVYWLSANYTTLAWASDRQALASGWKGREKCGVGHAAGNSRVHSSQILRGLKSHRITTIASPKPQLGQIVDDDDAIRKNSN